MDFRKNMSGGEKHFFSLKLKNKKNLLLQNNTDNDRQNSQNFNF